MVQKKKEKKCLRHALSMLQLYTYIVWLHQGTHQPKEGNIFPWHLYNTIDTLEVQQREQPLDMQLLRQ